MKKILSLALVIVMVIGIFVPIASAEELPVNGGRVDVVDNTIGYYTIQYLDVYKQDTYEAVSIVSAVQTDTTINIVLSKDTDSSSKLQVGFGGVGDATLQHSQNKCTLTDGIGKMDYSVAVRRGPQIIGTVTYNISFSIETSDVSSVKFTTDLTASEVKYIKNVAAEPLSVIAEYKGEEEKSVTYQWYKNTENNTETGVKIEGAVFQSYIPQTDDYGSLYYYVKASCEGLSAVSKVVKITVLEPYITINEQPEAAEYIKGDNAEALFVSAEQSEGKEVEYQWYKNNENNNLDGEKIEGATFSSYIPSATEEGITYYYAKINSLDKNGEKKLVATSNTAIINVKLPVVSFSGTTGGNVTYLLNGDNVTPFEVSALQNRGGEVSYQWYKSVDGTQSGGEVIEGATFSAFIPPVNEVGTYCYYVVASSFDSTPAISGIYTVNVCEMGVKFTTDLPESVTLKHNENLLLSVVAEPTVTNVIENFEENVSYQWYKNTEKSNDGGEPIGGATFSSYSPDVALGTSYYYVVATLQYDGISYQATSVVTTVNVQLAPVVIYKNGTDGSNWGDSYAYINELRLGGAIVDSYSWDGNNCTVKLNPQTADNGEIELSFSVGGTMTRWFNAATLNGNDIKSAQKGTVVLENGKATAVIYAKGLRSGVTKTINISVPSVVPPVCIKNEDTLTAYAGVETVLDISKYFENADDYYLVKEDGTKEILEGNEYRFIPENAGGFRYAFTSSNELGGDCVDTVVVTVNAIGVEGGAWIRNITSNGCLESVSFTDENDNFIEGLDVSVNGTTINVTIPRTFGFGSKIKANFALTQTNGLPFISGSSAFNQGIGTTTSYTTVISSGVVTKALYLYNSKPGATNNNYTTYTIKYTFENKIPALADGIEAVINGEIVAGEEYNLDLVPVFSDEDGDELTYFVKINGGKEVQADANYSFVPELGGTYTLEFFANDGIAKSAESYTVNLTVANSAENYSMTVKLPVDISPEFYITNGHDENGDILGEQLTCTSPEDGIFTVTFPKNITEISLRDSQYGGMWFLAENTGTVEFVKVETKISDPAEKEVPGSVTVFSGDYKVLGKDGKFLLDKGKEYKFSTSVQDESLYKNASQTLVVGDENVVTVKVSYKNPKTITAPTGAKVKLFRRLDDYYVHTPYEPLAVEDNGDGTSTYIFLAEGDLSYRVSMEGKITKAGYLTRNSATVIYKEDDHLPGDRVDYDKQTSNASMVADDSLLLNINQQNHLSLSVGETKTIKAYRAWEIVNNHLNHIIEPDFHFNIISGNDVVSLSPYENQPMVNSSGNWFNLTAVGEGTAVIEVTYDAIEISGGNYEGFYGASDSARCGLFVVTAGGETPDVDFGIDCKTGAGSIVYNDANKKPWDSELDTLYFFGEKGEIKFSPAFANGSITEVAVSGDKGNSYIILDETEGVYTAPVLPGNNIIRVTTDKGIAYQTVRGDRIKLSILNKSNEGEPICAGDTLSIRLIGVHTPVPKISGTYNPGFINNIDGESRAYIHYNFGETTVRSNGTQYDFSRNGTTFEFTVPENSDDSEFVLSDGYIGVGVIGVTGFPYDGDSHRNIPVYGNTRETKTTFTTRSILPEIEGYINK